MTWVIHNKGNREIYNAEAFERITCNGCRLRFIAMDGSELGWNYDTEEEAMQALKYLRRS